MIFDKSITPRQQGIYNTLHRLWTEHVMWTRSFIISKAFDLGDLDDVTKRLLQNPKDFAKVLKPIYGDRIAKKFEELLTEHLMIGAQLVNAAKAGDSKEAEKAREKWYANADEIALFLDNLNPYWNYNTWKNLLYDHLKMTEDEAAQILTKQYEESIYQYDKIQEEALKMADVMANGIIKQHHIQ